MGNRGGEVRYSITIQIKKFLLGLFSLLLELPLKTCFQIANFEKCHNYLLRLKLV